MDQLKKKVNIVTLLKKKKNHEKIAAVTAYDYITARIASEAGMDIILVGDSLGMVVQGHPNTLKVTMEQMIYHTRMVARAKPESLVIGDMPFAAYHVNPEESVRNAIRFIREGNAEAVKLEGGRKRFATIQAILDAEIPVMGHLGLTPQSVYKLGGFRIQGKAEEQAREMIEDALQMEKMGVFALILEAIPAELGRRITEAIKIPTIGIGAGPHCDGQILVINDLLGLSGEYQPKFARRYAKIGEDIRAALEKYIADVKEGDFPSEDESYSLKKNK
jgi:3-methyl-2-oxobutanoate hydroxymethyltransferase